MVIQSATVVATGHPHGHQQSLPPCKHHYGITSMHILPWHHLRGSRMGVEKLEMVTMTYSNGITNVASPPRQYYHGIAAIVDSHLAPHHVVVTTGHRHGIANRVCHHTSAAMASPPWFTHGCLKIGDGHHAMPDQRHHHGSAPMQNHHGIASMVGGWYVGLQLSIAWSTPRNSMGNPIFNTMLHCMVNPMVN